MTMISKKFPAAALIDGEWVTSAKTFSVTDPATGAEVAAVPDLGAGDAARAIDAAARALPSWSAKTAKDRATILRRWFDLITSARLESRVDEIEPAPGDGSALFASWRTRRRRAGGCVDDAGASPAPRSGTAAILAP